MATYAADILFNYESLDAKFRNQREQQTFYFQTPGGLEDIPYVAGRIAKMGPSIAKIIERNASNLGYKSHVTFGRVVEVQDIASDAGLPSNRILGIVDPARPFKRQVGSIRA